MNRNKNRVSIQIHIKNLFNIFSAIRGMADYGLHGLKRRTEK